MIPSTVARAIADWRRVVAFTYPLSAGMPVLVGGDPQAHAPFEAYTDNRVIHLRLNRPDQIRRQFTGFATRHHGAASAALYGVPRRVPNSILPENLAYDTFQFILFHELYHPLVCPNSREDEIAVSTALYRGLAAQDPALASADLVAKVDACKNLVWDIVVNVTFLARSQGVRRDILADRIAAVFRENKRRLGRQPVPACPKGMLPLLYLVSARNRTTDVLISLAGMFYATLSYNEPGVRERSMRVFLDDLAAKGVDEAAALDHLRRFYRGLIDGAEAAGLAARGIEPAEFRQRVALVHDVRHPSYPSNQDWLLRALDEIFDAGELRHAALQGWAQAMGGLIPTHAKQGSPDPETTSWGSLGPEGSESASADATPAEKNAGSLAQTLADLAGELGDEKVGEVLDQWAGGGGSGPGGGGLDAETARALRELAQDERLKRAAEPIDIRAPAAGLAAVDLGTQIRWEHRRSHDLTAGELASLDLPKIVSAQTASGLPILLQRTDDRWMLNEFVLAESPVRGWGPCRLAAHVPDHWILLVDSSGSMCGDRFELLLQVTYGIQKGLYEVCRTLNRDLKFGVVNFSSATEYSGLHPFRKTYAARIHPAKRVLFHEQSGSTSLDVSVFERVRADRGPGSAVFTLITDGQIENDDEVYAAVEAAARERETAFLFVEIGSRSALGGRLEALAKQLPGMSYAKVDKIEEIRERLRTVLIRYGAGGTNAAGGSSPRPMAQP